MESERERPEAEEHSRVRWIPSVLLDLAPAEPVTALRTPHRVMLQAIPATRPGLVALLGRARREQLDDPKLIAILDDIELRAAVELAKLSGPNGL